MVSKRRLERLLATVDRFEEPRLDLEQYPTPPTIAAHVVNLAALRGDLAGRTVVDFGSGPGILALGCAFCEPAHVVGIERDRTAIRIARGNERSLSPPVRPMWIWGDATVPPLCTTDATVVMNPPFGAQAGHAHADRAFLSAANRIARVTYSMHNAGSRDFIHAFAADSGGTITDEVAVEMDLTHQFPFHTADRTSIDVELYRIEWRNG